MSGGCQGVNLLGFAWQPTIPPPHEPPPSSGVGVSPASSGVSPAVVSSRARRLDHRHDARPTIPPDRFKGAMRERQVRRILSHSEGERAGVKGPTSDSGTQSASECLGVLFRSNGERIPQTGRTRFEPLSRRKTSDIQYAIGSIRAVFGCWMFRVRGYWQAHPVSPAKDLWVSVRLGARRF